MNKRLLIYFLFISALWTENGCAPMGTMAPSYFAETAKSLEAGQTAVTAVGGAGYALDGMAAGGGARLRIGVSAHQEVGVEGAALWVRQSAGYDDPWRIVSGSYSGKLSWKLAPLPWLAVVAGVSGAATQSVSGARDSENIRIAAVGGDLGLLGSWR